MSAVLKRLHFFVRSRSGALKFWENVVELVVEELIDQTQYASLMLGDCLLEIQEIPDGIADQWESIDRAVELPTIRWGTVFRLNIQVDDLAAFRARLEQHQIVFKDTNDEIPPAPQRMIGVDASGVFVQITQHHL